MGMGWGNLPNAPLKSIVSGYVDNSYYMNVHFQRNSLLQFHLVLT